jgi:hypothetical protein
MKNLPFLKELTEARMFFGPDDVKGKSAEDIAEVIYLIIMMLQIIRYFKPSWSSNYASQTLSYNTYENMHYSGTDLGNLLAVLNNQDTFKGSIKVNGKLNIPLFQINRYLTSVRGAQDSASDDATFFYRLEDYLKLYSKGNFRRLRRDIGDWENLSYTEKSRIVLLLRQEFDKKSSSCDIYLWFKQNYKLSTSESIVRERGIDKLGISYHSSLNPALWENENELRQDVKFALEKIANKFSEFIDVKQIAIIDYVITGSNCAYNYSENSDIDLHVLVDATALGDNPLTEPFLTAKKALWNSGHDITIKGYTVELYAEDVNKDADKLVATGIYSLLSSDWIKKPAYDAKIQINDAAVTAKAKDIIDQISAIVKSGDAEHIDQLQDHIRKMRRAGLDKGGEFSVENLAFKVVRNSGVLNQLHDYKMHNTDQALSMEAAVSP